MKYGLNMLLWTASITPEHFPLLERLRDWGYDGVEIPCFARVAGQIEAIRRQLDNLGMDRTLISIVSADANPLDPDPAIRGRALDFIKGMVDAAHDLGSSTLVGPLYSPVGRLVGRGRTTDEWGWAADVFRKAAQYAASAGITITLEHLNRFETYFMNATADAARFVDEVGHPNLKIMYDTFHANIEEKSLRDAIVAGGKRINLVHISENDRSTPGEGHVDFDQTFAALAQINYDGPMIIEAFGNALPELAAATCIWRQMIPSFEHVARNGLKFMKQKAAQYGLGMKAPAR